MRRSLAFAAGGFSVWMFLEHIIGVNAISLSLFALTFVGLFVFLCIKGCVKTAVYMLIGVLIGFGYNYMYESTDVRLPKDIEGESKYVQAYVTDYPSETSRGNGAKFTVEFRKLDGKTLKKPIRAMFYYDKPHTKLKPGDIFVAKVKISLPQNTPEFNGENYYKTEKLDVSAFLDGDMQRYPCERVPIEFLHKTVAWKIKNNIQIIFPGDASSFVTALLIGDKEGLNKGISENMRITGLTHTIAVSGMHISCLVGIIIFLFGKRRAAFIAIPVTLVFTFIAGCSPSIVRAFVMQLFILIAPLIMREADVPTAMLTALAAILFNNPYAICDVGLQLSFAATVGIVSLSPIILSMLMKRNKYKSWTVKGKIKHKIVLTVSVAISASLATIPLIAYYFKSLSIISVFANIILIWLFNLMFFTSVVLVIIGFVYMPIAKWLGNIGLWIFGIIQKSVEFAAKLPYASVYAHSAYVVLAIAVAYIGAAAVLVLYKKKDKIYKSAIVLTFALHGLLAVLPAALSKTQNLKITALDVGQGQCIVAEYDDVNLVIDCGGDLATNAGDIVYNRLLSKNTRTVDAIILTHFHEDHTNGVENLLRKAIVKKLYISRWRDSKHSMDKIISTAHECGTKVIIVDCDMHIDFGGISTALYAGGWSSSENNTSTAVILGMSGFEFVVTGDLSGTGEKRLVERGNLPDAEVYVAGHHGSPDSSTAALIRAIKPEYSVVSLDESKYSSFPNFEVCERFNNADVKVLRTDDDGSITFEVDAEGGAILEIIKAGRRKYG